MFSTQLHRVSHDDAATTVFKSDIKMALTNSQVAQLAEALKSNKHVTEVNMYDSGLTSADAKCLADVLKVNSTIQKMDLSNNRIGADGLIALAEALHTNKTLKELRVADQQHRTGIEVEKAFGEMYKHNTTLTTLSITIENVQARMILNKGEVRNKEIAKRITHGQDWSDLDPARQTSLSEMKRKQREEEREKQERENAEILEKVPSTGGPYTLRQLSCKKQFQPDDVDPQKKEQWLSDDEFRKVFGMEKADFGNLPQWKRQKMKKDKGLF